jgi:hypothetical protein
VVEVTLSATETRPLEASGTTYAAALATFRQSIPEGWTSLDVIADD